MHLFILKSEIQSLSHMRRILGVQWSHVASILDGPRWDMTIDSEISLDSAYLAGSVSVSHVHYLQVTTITIT